MSLLPLAVGFGREADEKLERDGPLPPPASWTVLTAFSDRAELPARSFEKGVDEVKPFDATSIE
jgi:hypothetical protein